MVMHNALHPRDDIKMSTRNGGGRGLTSIEDCVAEQFRYSKSLQKGKDKSITADYNSKNRNNEKTTRNY